MQDDSYERYARLNKVLDEVAACCRRGERPSLQELTDRHPDLADDLRELVPAMIEIEQVKGDQDQRSEPPLGGAGLQQLGDYRILREVGRGGMGIVYEAEQESLGRHVALKVLPSHALLEPRQVQRFQREARVAARLHHTNIVPVFGVGEHDGLHYYVMQYIHGSGLDQVLDELRRLRPLPDLTHADGPEQVTPGDPSSVALVAQSLLSGVFAPPASGDKETGRQGDKENGQAVASVSLSPGLRVSLSSSSSDSCRLYWESVARIGIQAAEALAYAHSQGTLHRDIKPSNLLLDTQGIVWVTDFGLAKASDSEPDNLTRTGDVVGTLRYMAPERFKGKADARSDLYALGLTLYELLTLRPAFADSERSRLLVQVLHDEPPRPRKLNPAVPRDLETIVLKTIARDPGHRYQTARELVEDLRRYLDDRPIRARRVSELERAWRFCRRNPSLSLLSLAFVLTLVVGSAGIFWKWREAEHERGQAMKVRDAANQAHDTSQRVLATTMLDKGIALAEQGEIGEGLFWMLEGLKEAPPTAPELHALIRTNLSGWTPHAPGLRQVIEHPKGLGNCLFSPDGQRLVIAADDSVRCYALAPGPAHDLRRELVLQQTGPIALSPDGKILLACNRGDPSAKCQPQRWDLATGQPLGPPLPRIPAVLAAVFTPDGRQFATAGVDGMVRLWDAEDGRLLREDFVHDNKWAWCLAISPDGKTLAVGTMVPGQGHLPATAALWDLAEGKRVGQALEHKQGISSIAFAPDGGSVLTGCEDGTVQLWDRAGKPIGLPMRHPHPVRVARFAPDGRSIATAGNDGIVRWWDPASGYPLIGALPVQRGHLNDLCFSPDGSLLATASAWEGQLGALQLWELARTLSKPAGKGKEAVLKAAWVTHATTPWYGRQIVVYSPDRRRALTGGNAGVARLWDTATGQPLLDPLRQTWPVAAVLAWSPDGRRLATASLLQTTGIGDARLWDADTGQPIGAPLAHINWVAATAFSPDSKLLASGGYDAAVQFWDSATGQRLGDHLLPGDIVQSLHFSPDGQTLAVGRARDLSGAAGVILWDVASRRQVGKLMPGPRSILRFSPDGARLLAAENASCRLWDPATREPVGLPLGQQAEVNSAAFSPDGQLILTGSTDGTARLWDLSGNPVGAPMQHPQRINVVAFSPDPEGRWLLTGCGDGSARLWDRVTHRPLGPVVLQERAILAAAFLPDGKGFLTSAEDGRTRTWPVHDGGKSEGSLERLALRLQVRTGLEMGPAQTVRRLDTGEWEKRRQQLTELEGSLESAHAGGVNDSTYHDARARDAEQARDSFAAGWHLERLLAAKPEDRSVLLRRAFIRTILGRFVEAEADYARAARTEPKRLLSWYQHCAVECRESKRWQTALWYLDRLIAAVPNEWQLYADRAQVHQELGKVTERTADQDQAAARGAGGSFLWTLVEECGVQGQWERAARYARLLAERGGCPYFAWAHPAEALLKAGDRQGYRRLCARMLREKGVMRIPAIDKLLAGVCVLGPEAVEDFSPVVTLAEGAVSKIRADQKADALNTMGGVLYRAGRYREAIERLTEGIKLRKDQGTVQDWLFLALAHHRLGEFVEERYYLDLVKQAKPLDDPWARLEVELLRQEVARLSSGP